GRRAGNTYTAELAESRSGFRHWQSADIRRGRHAHEIQGRAHGLFLPRSAGPVHRYSRRDRGELFQFDSTERQLVEHRVSPARNAAEIEEDCGLYVSGTSF